MSITKKIKHILYKFIEMKDDFDFSKICNFPNVQIHAQNELNKKTVFNFNATAQEISFGKNVGCRNYCNFLVYPHATLIIGEGVFFNNYCSVNCLGYIEIGENTLFGEGVKLYDHNHKYYHSNGELIVERASFIIGKISIGKNCWIGSNVTILNNVVIGDNVIIGANCLIYKSIPSNSIVKHSEQLIVENF